MKQETINAVKRALEWFTESFEVDFMIDGAVVDAPDKMWRPIIEIYKIQKQALGLFADECEKSVIICPECKMSIVHERHCSFYVLTDSFVSKQSLSHLHGPTMKAAEEWVKDILNEVEHAPILKEGHEFPPEVDWGQYQKNIASIIAQIQKDASASMQPVNILNTSPEPVKETADIEHMRHDNREALKDA